MFTRRPVYSRKITIKFTTTVVIRTNGRIPCRQSAAVRSAKPIFPPWRRCWRAGFPNRGRQFWLHALRRLTGHEPPPGLPKYGYLLETGGVPVGAILLICSTMREGDQIATRCNLSSWYVEPAYRTYATLLVSQALRHKDVTYLNVSAAPHTWPIIEAQGFSRYCDGVFVAMPTLQGLFSGAGVKVFDAAQKPAVAFDPFGPGNPARAMPSTAASACGARPPSAPTRSCSARGWSRASCPARR